MPPEGGFPTTAREAADARERRCASESFDFTGSGGDRLAGLLQLPDGEPVAYALFAHCFTCGKDVRAAAQLARSLAELGIATLRFDFTGLGASAGEFARTTFTSNVQDLVAAADALRDRAAAPKLLIGHSLGGAAILAAAPSIPESVAVATIGAPFDTAHALHLFADALPALEREGEAPVEIAGRRFTVGRDLVRDLASQDQAAPDPGAAAGAAGDARAGRRCRRHRERVADLRGGTASQELRLARHRRPPAEPARGCRLRGARPRGLGVALRRRPAPLPADG